MSNAPGSVSLVGAGPGDPGLLTLRAAEALHGADALLYDALVSDAIVALAPASCERVFVGKRGGAHAMPQDEIERLMIAKARAGQAVVRLKGGDPFVFGRGGEEAQALRAAGVAFDVVPGISSAVAAPAYAGIPLTHRELAPGFTVVTGHEDPTKPASLADWDKLADASRTLVVLMATATLADVAERLVAHGLDGETPATIVQNGTLPDQRTVEATVATIAGAAAREKIGSPAVLVVGRVARLRDELRWFDSAALFGKRVLITRAGGQSDAFAQRLLARGAEPIVAPTIAIEPPDDTRGADDAIAALASFDWIAFTSQNGVEAFFERLARHGGDARRIGAARVAAIGERTAERIRSYGVVPDLTPSTFVSEEAARELIAQSRAGDRVLIYGASESREVLPAALERAGRRTTAVAAYKTVVATDAAFGEKAARADVWTFTSASTVRGFAELVGAQIAAAQGKCVACIGPITAQAARAAGMHVDVVARVSTTVALLDALQAHFEGAQ